MAVLTKSAAAAANAPEAGGIAITTIIAVIETLIKFLGPVAVPIIEGWIAKLPLTPAQIAAIDAFIEKLLNPLSPVTP